MTDWPTPAPAAEAWTHIDTQVLGAPAASVSFAGIAAAAAPRLRLHTYLIKDASAATIGVRLNNDAGANYDRQRLHASGAVIGAARNAGQIGIFWNTDQFDNDAPALALMSIFKPVAGEVARATVAVSMISDVAVAIYYEATAAEWADIANLINRVDVVSLAGNFVAGTRVVLEGAA